MFPQLEKKKRLRIVRDAEIREIKRKTLGKNKYLSNWSYLSLKFDLIGGFFFQEIWACFSKYFSFLTYIYQFIFFEFLTLFKSPFMLHRRNIVYGEGKQRSPWATSLIWTTVVRIILFRKCEIKRNSLKKLTKGSTFDNTLSNTIHKKKTSYPKI